MKANLGALRTRNISRRLVSFRGCWKIGSTIEKMSCWALSTTRSVQPGQSAAASGSTSTRLRERENLRARFVDVCDLNPGLISNNFALIFKVKTTFHYSVLTSICVCKRCCSGRHERLKLPLRLPRGKFNLQQSAAIPKRLRSNTPITFIARSDRQSVLPEWIPLSWAPPGV